MDSKVRESIFWMIVERTGEFAEFVATFFRRFWRPPYEWKELINQMDEAGSRSFILIAVTGLAIGVVLSMQSRGTLVRFGAESVLPRLLALSVVKEMGPVFTSIMLAGRLGAGMGAELGSMRVTEQIDALEVAALKPFNYLVVTRVLACMIMFPIMTIFTDVLALAGGFVDSAINLGMDYRIYIDTVLSSLRFSDILVDTGKTVIFGFIVGMVSCFLGYTVRGGTRQVGQAAMQAVVLSSLLILLADVIIVRISMLLFA